MMVNNVYRRGIWCLAWIIGTSVLLMAGEQSRETMAAMERQLAAIESSDDLIRVNVAKLYRKTRGASPGSTAPLIAEFRQQVEPIWGKAAADDLDAELNKQFPQGKPPKNNDQEVTAKELKTALTEKQNKRIGRVRSDVRGSYAEDIARDALGERFVRISKKYENSEFTINIKWFVDDSTDDPAQQANSDILRLSRAFIGAKYYPVARIVFEVNKDKEKPINRFLQWTTFINDPDRASNVFKEDEFPKKPIPVVAKSNEISPKTTPYTSSDATTSTSSKSYGSSNSTGTVYVKGYHRKDGTYVRPHTRRK